MAFPLIFFMFLPVQYDLGRFSYLRLLLFLSMDLPIFIGNTYCFFVAKVLDLNEIIDK